MSTTNYGVEFNTTIGAPELTRMGNMGLHHYEELPVHNQIRKAVVRDDGSINYWLHRNSDLLKEDGVTPSALDGTDGQVVTHIPAHWVRFDTRGNDFQVQVSDKPLLGYRYQRAIWVGAYEGAVYRPDNKLSSVINTTPDYRGGHNAADWDGDDRSLLGKPATSISLINFINYAGNLGDGWLAYMWEMHHVIWYLYLIEYANRHTQLAFDPTPTAEGFRQGGLGPGVTTILSADWADFNSTRPFVPCGVTTGLGANTGAVDHTINNWKDGAPVTVSVPSYRGIENWFGHIHKWTAGLLFDIQSELEGGQSVAYLHKSGPVGGEINENFKSAGLIPRVTDYLTKVQWGPHGMMIPNEASGGSATTYFADRFYASIPETGRSTRGPRVGGGASRGAAAGPGCVLTYYSPSKTGAGIGSRLCRFGE